MEIKEFIKKTRNKWIKIQKNDFTIIQNITSLKQIKNKSYVECYGYSISNFDGDIRELDTFFMTKDDISGNFIEIDSNDVEKEIHQIKGL